jgi:hypothetical protein
MGLFGGGPDKVLERGQLVGGTVVAIRVSQTSINDSIIRQDEYVVDLGGRRLGVRQRLDPDDRMRLGMQVAVRLRDDDLFIDWPTTMAQVGVAATHDTYRWKSIKDWGGTGIEDETNGLGKAAKNGMPAWLRIERLEHRSHLGGMIQALSIAATVMPQGGAAYSIGLDKQMVPHYASHLATSGRVVPAFIDAKRPDKVAIDWPGAAMREPGVGVPPSTEAQRPASTWDTPVAAMSSGSLAADGSWVPPPPPPGHVPPPPIEGVSWETYLTVETMLQRNKVKPRDWDAVAQGYGVPPGRWPQISQAWGRAMMVDPALQAAYAAAMRS